MFQSVTFLTEWDQVEMTVLCRHIYFDTFVDNRFCFQTVSDQILDADNLDIEFFSNFH